MSKKNLKLYAFTDDELKKLQSKGLEMLIYFKKFCDDNNLLFYMCGGCCIGSVRHKGFIPWDDDVDVFMPRDDYEKLGKLWKKKADTSKYEYCDPDGRRNLFATINDNHTTFIKALQADLDINQGLVLDVLPLDGYPNSSVKRKMQMFWALIYSLFCAQVVPEKHGKTVALIGRTMLGLIPSCTLRKKIWKFAEKKMTKYKIADCDAITELCSGPGYMKNRYPKDIFESAVYKEFEGYMMPVPKGYDEYLKIAFGDYMALPEEKDRVMHHDVIFCDLENSYKKYKGKKYCLK